MSARFEVVRTDGDQPWHARFRAANGLIVWTTETYARRRAARKAVDAFARPLGGYVDGDHVLSQRDRWQLLEIRELDERITEVDDD